MTNEIDISPRQIAKAIQDLLDENELLQDKIYKLEDRINKTIEVIDTQMKLVEDGAKGNLRIIKFYLIKGSCSMYDLITEEDYKYKKG